MSADDARRRGGAGEGGRFDVVHVAHTLKFGLRSYLVDLLTGVGALGVAQALVYSSREVEAATAGAVAALRAGGVALFDVPMVRALSPLRDAGSVRELRRLVRQLRPAVLHLHSSKAGGLGRLAAVGIGRGDAPAVIYTPHASAANLALRYALLERALGRLRTDRVVAVSASEYDELLALAYVSPSRLVRVDTGVAVDAIRRLAADAPPPLPAGRLVVAVGRLSAQKDPQFLVRVSRRLAAAHPELHFVWAGDGELRGAVERDIAAAGLGARWTLLGALANPYPVLRAAAAVVLPSRYEGLPLVLLEAMALGRPMVATDVTGSRDVVIPNVTGELVPLDDEPAFAAAIARIVSAPDLAARYGAEAARRATRYTHERMAAEMVRVYAEAMGRESGGAKKRDG